MLYNFSHRFHLPPLVDVTKVYSKYNISKTNCLQVGAFHSISKQKHLVFHKLYNPQGPKNQVGLENITIWEPSHLDPHII